MAIRMVSAALLFVLLIPAAFAAAADNAIGRMIQAAGAVEVVDGAGSVRSIIRGGVFHEGDTFRTGADGRAQLRMADNSLISLASGTEFEFVEFQTDGFGGNPDRAAYRLHGGCMRTITGSIGEDDQDEYRLVSDYGELRIRGTTYECAIAGALYCGVSDGGITLDNAGGTVALGLGQNHDFAMVAAPNAAPVPLLQMQIPDCDDSNAAANQEPVDLFGTGSPPARQAPAAPANPLFPEPAPIRITPVRQ